jgi:hypothetical protein
MRNRRQAPMSLLLAAVTVGLLLAAFTSAPAAAGTPCWKQVLNDWSNGRAIGHYPLHCYRDAIRNLPEDLRDYSSAADDIRAALQAEISNRENRHVQSAGGDNGNGKTHPSQSAYRRAIDNLGTSNADAVPIPLLVLASLGGALLLAAAGLTARKRIRARRTPPNQP